MKFSTTFFKRNNSHFPFRLLMILVFCLGAGKGWGQIVNWNPGTPTALTAYGPTPWAPTTVNANLTVGGLTRGAGIGTVPTAAGSAWGGTMNTASVITSASAITNNMFVTFSIKPNTGFIVSLSTFDLFYRHSSTGPASGLLQYAIGAGSYVDIATLSFPTATSGGAAITQVSLAGISALQSVPTTSTINFRIVLYNNTTVNGPWYVFSTGLSIGGTVASAATAPTLTTPTVSAITTGGATLGATVTADGGASLTSRGTVWATTSSPTTNAVAEGGTTVAAFTHTRTGMAANTFYYYRGYAINSAGTGYSADGTFTTLANVPNAPTVNSPTTGSLAVAIGSGDLNPAATEYAIQETGSSNYVQADGTLAGTTVWQTAAVWGTKTVTGLSVNTSYTFQVKARNSLNTETGFGSTASKYTLANVPTAPTVGNPTTVTLDVTVGGADGNPSPTTYAIYETTTSQYLQANGSLGASAVFQTAATWATKTVTGLAPGTTYIFEVKAKNGDATETAFGTTANGTTTAGLITPALTAASGATVDANFDITFTDDAAWRTAVTSVKYGLVTLTAVTDYAFAAGILTLKPAGNAALQVAGTQAVTVIATGYSNATVSQTIGAGAATKLAMNTQPTAPASNGALLATQPKINIQDQYGNTVTGSTDAVTAAVAAGAWTLGGTVSVNAVSGLVTFTDFTATSPGPVTGATILFSSGSLTTVTSGTFNIPAPPPPALTAAAGATVDASFNITFTDNPTWRAAVSSVQYGATTLTAVTDYTFAAGILTLIPSGGNAALHVAGTQTVTVAATGYSNATVSQTIGAGVATKLGMNTQPTAPATNGAVLATQPKINIQDQYGNTVTTNTDAVTAAVGAGTWTLGGTVTVNAVSGVVTFAGLTATSSSSVTGATIQFSSGSLTAVTSGTFNIPAPPPPTLTAAVGATVDASFNISFTDNASWRAAVTSVKYGAVTLTAVTDYSFAAGTLTLIPGGGNAALHVAGTQTVTVIATNYSDATVSQAIGAGVATKLTMNTQPTAPATNGTVLATQPKINLEDQYSNLVITSTAAVTAAVGAGTWTLGGTVTVNAVAGVVTYAGLTATSIAAVTGADIQFTSGSLTGVTSATFNIPVPTADHIAFVGVPASGFTSCFLGSFTVEARRSDNTVDNTYTGSIVISVATGAGTIAGTLTVSAVAGIATFNNLILSTADSYTLYANSGTFSQITSGTIVIKDPIARWNFDVVTIVTTPGTTLSISSAVADAGAQPTASLITGLHASAATIWSVPAGNFSTKSITSDHWAIGDYWQFRVNASGYYNIGVNFDQIGSATGPNNFKFQYSTDGTTFTDVGTYSITGESWSATTGPRKIASSKSFDLSAITALNGVTVYFRLVCNSTTGISSTFGSGGTNRVDNFTVTGTANNTWIGTTAVATDATNWSNGTTPDGNSYVTIPASPTGGSMPVLSGNLSVKNISLLGSSTVNLGGQTLTINGAVSGTGTFTGSPTSNLVIGGTAGTLNFTQTTAATRSLNNLTLNVNTASATLGTALDVYGNIKLNDGTLALGGLNLTLKSNTSNTASIDKLKADGSNLTGAGNVTMERWIPLRSGLANGGRAYRVLTPTVTTATNINANWQEGLTNTVIGTNEIPAAPYQNFGVQITGAGGSGSGFDVTQSNQSSLFTFINGNNYNGTTGFPAVSNTNSDLLNAKTGYFLYIRGDRSMNTQIPYAPSSMPTSSTTLRATGTVQKGNIVFDITGTNNSDFIMITNPYPAPIDWSAIAAGNSFISGKYTRWDSNSGNEGGFVTVDPTSAYFPYTEAVGRYIQPGEAFFVQKTATGTSITITEAMKAIGFNTNVIYRPTTPFESFSTELYLTEANGYRHSADGLLVKYDNSYSAAVDASDADEINNWNENIAISRAAHHLAIEARPVIVSRDTIPLLMNGLRQSNYEFVFTPSMFSNTALKAELVDRFLGTRTLLSVTDSIAVPFTVTADAASADTNRFMVVFGPLNPLAIDGLSISARVETNGVQVNWSAQKETAMDRYELERSFTGTGFVKINTTAAMGNSAIAVNYNWLDGRPQAGINFYRIRAVDKAGQVKYTNVVKVNAGRSTPSLTVVPNPVTGNIINLQLSDLDKGSYTVVLYDDLGQQVFTTLFEHVGGSVTKTLTLHHVLSNGLYRLVLTYAGGTRITTTLIKN